MTQSSFSDVLQIVEKAGEKLKQHFGNITVSHYKTECAADIVTSLDQETEQFLENELKRLDPTIGFKGEEFGKKNNADRFWLTDPIDGTGYFVRGVPGCTIMLALIEEGEITASVIYDFVLDKMYYAQKGKGAFCNKKKIQVSNRPLKEAFIHVEADLDIKKNIPFYLELCRRCIVLGSYPAGIHYALIAEGKIEGRINFDPFGNDYDFAAGELLVQEAGGIVANIGSDTLDYTNLNTIATNKEVYHELTSGKDAIFPIIHH